MIFRVIDKKELERMFDRLAEKHAVVGPVERGKDSHGKQLYSFAQVFDFEKMRLDYTTTKLPAKRFFLPYREDLATFGIEGAEWHKAIDYHVDAPIVLFGLHACDINALNRLDKVLLGSIHPMPYYAARRRNVFLIGVGCMPQPFCFCRSMGTDTALHGFDLFITDIGDSYFVEILSATAYDVISAGAAREPKEQDHVRFRQVVEAKNARFTEHVDTTDLGKILDMEFQSPVWDQWGQRCLGCGTCANVCPTCYCYGVEETVAPGLATARKTKTLYSCNVIDFATVAGGHNFRPERSTRLKYRYYHKHRGFVEAYEESLCVGCGRCGEACLAGITVPEVIASVRGEEVAA